MWLCVVVAITGSFWNDLVNLQLDYTGILALKPLKSKEILSCGEDLWLVENKYKPCHIVDGQQLITRYPFERNRGLCTWLG